MNNYLIFTRRSSTEWFISLKSVFIVDHLDGLTCGAKKIAHSHTLHPYSIEHRHSNGFKLDVGNRPFCTDIESNLRNSFHALKQASEFGSTSEVTTTDHSIEGESCVFGWVFLPAQFHESVTKITYSVRVDIIHQCIFMFNQRIHRVLHKSIHTRKHVHSTLQSDKSIRISMVGGIYSQMKLINVKGQTNSRLQWQIAGAYSCHYKSALFRSWLHSPLARAYSITDKHDPVILLIRHSSSIHLVVGALNELPADWCCKG